MYKLVMAENDIAQVGLPILYAVLAVLALLAVTVASAMAYNEIQRMKTDGRLERLRVPDDFSWTELISDLKTTSADFYDGKLGDLRKRYMHQGSHRYNKLAA